MNGRNATHDPVMKNRVVIVTGSSMGIGKATAIEMGRRGATVVLNGRSADRLQATADELTEGGIRTLAIPADVASSVDATRLVDRTLEEFGRLDMLINNAGMSMRGLFENLDDEVVRQVVGSNLLGAINVTRAALPHIRSSRGHVIFISSVAGIRGLPWISVYGASKMALTGLAESLRLELYDSGVHVGVLYVGITQNEAEKKVMNADGELVSPEWKRARNGQTREQVALAVLKMIKKRKFKLVLTGLGRLQAIVNRVSPAFAERILRFANKSVDDGFR